VYLSTGDCLDPGGGDNGIGAWSSPDGITWTPVSCVHVGSEDDRESMWVDNNPASDFYGRIYVSWNDFNDPDAAIYVSYSDDGTSWTGPIQVSNTALDDFTFYRNVQVTVSPDDGTVYIAAMDEGGGGLSPRTNYVFRSTDGGDDWTQTQVGKPFKAPGKAKTQLCGPDYFAYIPPIWRYEGWGDITAGPDGLVLLDYTQGSGGRIMVVRSTDHGTTWSKPAKTDSGGTQWMPSIASTPDGKLFESWYQSKNPQKDTYARWGRYSDDGGLTWAKGAPVSDTGSPPPTQPDPLVQECYAGDYQREYAAPTRFFVDWADARVVFDGAPQQDVFVDVVPAVLPPWKH